LMIRTGDKQARLGELCREVSILCTGVISLDGMNAAAIVVEEVQLAVVVFAKGDDAHRGAGDLRHLQRAVALEAGCPQTTRFPVAKHVGPAKLREFSATIDESARDAGAERVRIREQRWQNRCWP